MKEKKWKKYLACFVLAVFLIIPMFSPLSAEHINEKTSSIGSVTVYNTISGEMKKKAIDVNDFDKLMQILNDPMHKQTYNNQLQEKLETLVSMGLISDKTADDAYYCFINQNLPCNINSKPMSSKPIFFDAMNLFNGIFFGVKGKMQNTLMYLPVFQFPFFDDNITALFIGYTKMMGAGSVFTLGTLGFKYIYDFDQTSYEFPYFSPVTGNLIGFTGILIEVNIGGLLPEQFQGSYIIGVGMSIFTLWNKES
jgi:hypothetical protein